MLICLFFAFTCISAGGPIRDVPDMVPCPPVAVVLGQTLLEREIASATGEESEQVPFLERRLLGATVVASFEHLTLQFHRITSHTLATSESK
jgi:hypothetical protein